KIATTRMRIMTGGFPEDAALLLLKAGASCLIMSLQHQDRAFIHGHHFRPAALRMAAVSVSQTFSSLLRRERTRRKAAAPSGAPITKGWIPMTTVVASRAGSARASLAVNFREVVHSVRTGNADVAKPQRFAEDRMDTHKNARLTPKGREEMVRAVVDRGMSKAAAARQFNTTPKTVGKWAGRFCAEGVDGLRDRSSRPLSSPS